MNWINVINHVINNNIVYKKFAVHGLVWIFLMKFGGDFNLELRGQFPSSL
jgi:hypothetical protein